MTRNDVFRVPASPSGVTERRRSPSLSPSTGPPSLLWSGEIRRACPSTSVRRRRARGRRVSTERIIVTHRGVRARAKDTSSFVHLSTSCVGRSSSFRVVAHSSNDSHDGTVVSFPRVLVRQARTRTVGWLRRRPPSAVLGAAPGGGAGPIAGLEDAAAEALRVAEAKGTASAEEGADGGAGEASAAAEGFLRTPTRPGRGAGRRSSTAPR